MLRRVRGCCWSLWLSAELSLSAEFKVGTYLLSRIYGSHEIAIASLALAALGARSPLEISPRTNMLRVLPLRP